MTDRGGKKQTSTFFPLQDNFQGVDVERPAAPWFSKRDKYFHLAAYEIVTSGPDENKGQEDGAVISLMRLCAKLTFPGCVLCLG